ncbi:hypothetical protein AK830_g794 [Neonectria ditissima]|uniref:Uncharacterized protein n=1 Tax=Neonectria ditissima TaxID=78410 RepID=A0A0P7B6Y4_9HYPO|nr:hypothetical protein AK830_g794 [Neonectria ditissima]
MASLGRFTAALMAGSQENTMALAALNFDFSLYPIEAPKEYQALGSCLSDERRHMAEGGSQHVTARKLGAVFRSRLPSVPHLIRAFGERVSEIAQKTEVKHRSSTGAPNNPLRNVFSHKRGIDGTSIWAAATSGTDALCAQLLACMLARFWAADEATSIWAEILEARKVELSEREGDFDFPELAAMQATISRDQLAEWDASARAWLRTADEVHRKSQSQLRLIIENLDVEVNQKRNTYESVMEAWLESMKVVDRLVAGVPQSVHDGAALLGLSAWHLFPDMIVYANGCKEITQGDSLIKKGGILTAGLESAADFDAGVRWSLPLAKLRYYGDPVVIDKTFDLASSRVSIDRLMLIALGCLAREWPEMPEKFECVCRYYQRLWDVAQTQLGESVAQQSWLKYLGNAASSFLAANSEEQKIFRRLLAFGTRRGGKFLTDGSGSTSGISWRQQTLGLTSFDNFIKGLSRPELRVAYLRKVMKEVATHKEARDWIISYKTGQTKSAFATVFPSTGLRKSTRKYHCTWNDSSFNLRRPIPAEANASSEELDPEVGNVLFGWDYIGPRLKKGTKTTVLHFSVKSSEIDEESELTARYMVKPKKLDVDTVTIRFELMFGDPNFGAVFKRAHKYGLKIRDHRLDDAMEFEDILSALSSHELGISGLDTGEATQWRSLQALGMIGSLYSNLGSASLSLNVIDQELYSQKWCQATPQPTAWYQALQARRDTGFACIASMETGDQDLDPDMLKEVMALSVGDSIYSLSALFSDPHLEPQAVLSDNGSATRGTCIIRTLGNVGKYGISLLIPPPELKMRKPDCGQWNVINHDVWDGTSADSFGETSLHLFLTEYRVPYTTNHRGNRDIQAFFQEAAISIYDGKTWIGDIDILKALGHSSGTLLRVPELCKHGVLEEEQWPPSGRGGASKRKKQVQQETLAKEISCADNWYELIDKPDHPVLVRSRGNWLGRLAATSISVQLGYRVVLLPDNECPQGCFTDNKFMRDQLVRVGDVVIW